MSINWLSDKSSGLVSTNLEGSVNDPVSPQDQQGVATAHPKATLKAPLIATITDDVGVLVGTIAKAGVTDDAALLISGTAKSGVKVKVFDGKTSLGTIPVDESGQWRFTTPELKDGTHTFTVVAIDASGKTSSTSDAYKITVDTQAPIGPQFTLTDDAGRLTGIISSGTRTDDSTPSLTGNTESSASISVFDGKKLLGTTKADPTGAWSYTPNTLKDGTHTLKAIATDAAGNSSAASTSFTFVVDSQPPKPPTLDTVTDDQGLIKGVVPDQGATDDTRLKLAGTAPGNSTVELFDGTLSLGTTTAGNKGNWTFTTPTLADGQHLLTATTVDTLGTASVASESVTVTVDTQPPAAPSISSVLDNVGKKKGDVANGGKTDDTTLQLKGTVDPGSTVILYDYTVQIGQTTADNKGNWSFTTDTLANGSAHVLAAAVRDAAGNLSDIGASRTVSIDTGKADTLAPFAPTIESITDNYGD
ncbi:MAG: Ig-like domain-containing protein, partial [Methylococcaceae bacterium]